MFRSFYLAGFECATGYNMHGQWIDQVAATEHDIHVDSDYSRLDEVGIHAVREAVRWPLVDKGTGYDMSTVQPFVDAANRHGFDVVWDLFHYGYPDDLDPFSTRFAERFADYCHATALFIHRHMRAGCYFTPINEPSYFSWAAGEVGRFAPHLTGRGYELKVALARAALRGIAAIRDACPQARIVNVDPICRVVPAVSEPDAIEHARRFNEEAVFQFWDMLSGRLHPELGGASDKLDIVGLNYYWTNQWELGRDGVPLADNDPRRVPLADLVRGVWRRYGKEVVITETSALGEARGPWVHELSRMAEQLFDEGVALGGICLYPILGMPEWHARDQWTRMGLWDLEHEENALRRKVCAPMLEALRAAQVRHGSRTVPVTGTVLTLHRTGNAPMVVHGRVLWENGRQRGGARLALIRSDHPQRLWIAAIEVSLGEITVSRVDTAAELSLLLGSLRFYTPARIALEHGIADASALLPATEGWSKDLDQLAARARTFEAVRVHCSDQADVIGQPAGRRY